jgi:hypothetical protein
MTIKKKVTESQKDKVIRAAEKREESSERTQINVWMKKAFLKKIDDKVALREGMHRTAWILEAVQEKLGREI